MFCMILHSEIINRLPPKYHRNRDKPYEKIAQESERTRENREPEIPWKNKARREASEEEQEEKRRKKERHGGNFPKN